METPESLPFASPSNVTRGQDWPKFKNSKLETEEMTGSKTDGRDTLRTDTGSTADPLNQICDGAPDAEKCSQYADRLIEARDNMDRLA